MSFLLRAQGVPSIRVAALINCYLKMDFNSRRACHLAAVLKAEVGGRAGALPGGEPRIIGAGQTKCPRVTT